MSVRRLFHLLLITCLFVSIAFMVGCATEYEVEVQADPEKAGKIEGEGTYEEGDEVAVETNPKDGYEFKKWEKDGEELSQDQEYKFEVKENKKLVAEFAETVDIPDENLEAAIKQELGVNQVTKENIKELTSLEARREGISDLNNLGKAENLKNLNLSGNKIQDITALTELTGLEKLNLNNNEITDIKALHELTNLKEINLAGNEIDEISFLGELTDLEELSVKDLILVDFVQSPGDDYITYRVKSPLPLTVDVQVVNINEDLSVEQVFEPNSVTDRGELYSFTEASSYEDPFVQHVPKTHPFDVYKDHEWENTEVLKVVVREELDEGMEGEHKPSGEYKFDFKNREIIEIND
ncbi:leucine-rich repeat domain-containing protein [Natranaerofaba carboxydovora]|uniref:leucine-rich repeat domain-containing protein n=1 Tax=Natranaerofaba carboxydovora TaxID=2742683 RepID=UPI001F1293A3|nr:leucine-rich repeat domain-containing protein [Natranaerofaba carboxydovora]UMZ73529.1 Internalin-A [Natranaerofaba carboxydovora]UMZ75199.1 Internalin-A [Natranaerofaba carboxydovora]